MLPPPFSCGDETKIHDSFCVVFKTKIHPGDFPSPNTILTKIKSRCHENIVKRDVRTNNIKHFTIQT